MTQTPPPAVATKHQAHCRAPLGYVCCCVDKSTIVEEDLIPTTPSGQDADWEIIKKSLNAYSDFDPYEHTGGDPHFYKPSHDSDCAVHNEPALPNGKCDCGYDEERVKRGDKALAALDRLRNATAVVPKGWQLVPKEPTQAMGMAGLNRMNEMIFKEHSDDMDKLENGYKAMLATAPTAPVAAKQVEVWGEGHQQPEVTNSTLQVDDGMVLPNNQWWELHYYPRKDGENKYVISYGLENGYGDFPKAEGRTAQAAFDAAIAAITKEGK